MSIVEEKKERSDINVSTTSEASVINLTDLKDNTDSKYTKLLKEITLHDLFFDYYDYGLHFNLDIITDYDRSDKKKLLDCMAFMQSFLNPMDREFLQNPKFKPCKKDFPGDYQTWSRRVHDIAAYVVKESLTSLKHQESQMAQKMREESGCSSKRSRKCVKQTVTAIEGRLKKLNSSKKAFSGAMDKFLK